MSDTNLFPQTYGARGLNLSDVPLASLPGAIPRDDLDLLFGLGQSVLANFHQIHPFLVAHDQILERQFTALHLFDNRFESVHRLLEIQFCGLGLRLTAHRANPKLSTARRS